MAADLEVGLRIGARVDSAYRRSVRDATGRLRQLGDTFKRTDQEFRVAGGLIKHQRKLAEVREHHRKVGASADKMLAEAKAAYAGASKAAQKYGINVGNVIDRQRDLQAELRRTEARIATQKRRMDRRDHAGGVLRSMRARMLGVAGAGYGVARMVGGAMEREEQAQYLRTVVTGPDRDAAVGRAVGRAREYSRTSLASDEEVLNIQYALHSAGFNEGAVDAAEERVHRLAKVTKGAAGQVGEIFAITFNNMAEGMAGTVEQKMNRIGNVLAKTQFQYQIRDFGQLGEGLKYASASAVAAKVPLEDMAAVVGQLNSAGLQGSVAGEAFRAMLRTMGKASEEFGFRIVRTKDGAMDLVGTLENFKNSIDSDDVRMRLEELVDASDGRISEQDALVQMIQEAVGEEGSRGFSLLLPAISKMAIAKRDLVEAGKSNLVDEEYQRFLKGGAAQWTMLGQNVRQVGEIFANTLLPQITATTGWLARQAGRVSELIERYPWAGRLIGALALGFGLLTVGATALAAGIWVVNAAMLANPVGLVVAGFVAAGAIIYALWEPIGDAVGWVWEKIKKLWEWIKKVGDAIKGSALGRWIGRRFGDGSADETADDAPPAAGRPGRRRRGRGAVGRTLAAGVVAAPLAVAAAPAPQAGDMATTTAPASDYAAMQEEAARIGRTFEDARAGAATPPEDVAEIDLKALRGDVQALTEHFETTRAPAAPAPPGRDEDEAAGRAGAGPVSTRTEAGRGASIVFHTTIHIEGAALDDEDELTRRLERVMRRASVEAGLAENEDVF